MKLGKIIDSGIPVLGGILLALLVSLTFLQIILRQFFAFSLNWSDEVSQFSTTWMVLFGSIWVTKKDRHLNTGLKLHQKLNARQIYVIDSIIALLITITVAVVAYQNAIFAFSTMDHASLSLEWLKIGYIFIALPIASLGLCYYYLKNFLKNLTLIFKKD